MPVDPDRLRQLRNQRKLNRKQLAERARVSVRQLVRLESDPGSSATARNSTINRLAKALDVEPGALTGDLPIPEADHPKDDEQVQVSAQVDPHIHLFYALVKRRYGVNFTTLVNVAPLMFALLAEGSLLWRREKLEKVREAAEHLCGLGFGHLTPEEAEELEDSVTDPASGHMSFAFAARRAQEGAADEEESIRKGDLFGRDVGRAAFDHGYNRSTNNPFADYLRALGRDIDNSDVIEVDEGFLGYMTAPDFPSHIICKGDLEWITGRSADAVHALIEGVVRLRDVPEELWADECTDQRVAWLEEKYRDARGPVRTF